MLRILYCESPIILNLCFNITSENGWIARMFSLFWWAFCGACLPFLWTSVLLSLPYGNKREQNRNGQAMSTFSLSVWQGITSFPDRFNFVNLVIVDDFYFSGSLSMSEEQLRIWGPRKALDFEQTSPASSQEVHLTPPSSPSISPRRSARAAVANPRYFGTGIWQLAPACGWFRNWK